MNTKKFLMAVMLAACASGCYARQSDSQKEVKTSAVTLLVPTVENSYSITAEQEWGRKQYELIQRDPDITFIHNRIIDGYLDRLLRRLRSHLPEESPHIPTRITVVMGRGKYLTEGATSLPGGYIFLQLERLASIVSEDALATTLAHEDGHVELRHLSRRETQRKQLEDYIEAQTAQSSDDDRNAVDLHTFQASVSIYLQELEVKHEDEADLFAVRLARRSGYDLHDFEDFIQTQYSYPAFLRFLNRHRSGDDRVRRMDAEFWRIEALGLTHHELKHKAAKDRRFHLMQKIAAKLLKESGGESHDR